MTREEATKWLELQKSKGVQFDDEDDESTRELREKARKCIATAYNMAIKALEQEPTTKNDPIDYCRAFKIACELLNGSVLYGVDADRIFEIMMAKDGMVSNESYESYILNNLQELDKGQYASEPTTKNDLGVDLISREQALEPYKILENTDTLSVYTIRQNLVELPSVTPQEQRWIPISEKLPKEYSHVLVSTDENEVFIADYLGKMNDGTDCFDDEEGMMWEGDIIAWMPLPKAYEPQESEDKESAHEEDN